MSHFTVQGAPGLNFTGFHHATVIGHAQNALQTVHGQINLPVADVRVKQPEIHPSQWLMDFAMDILTMFANIGINVVKDPVRSCMELVVLFVLLVFLWLVHYHWDRVCFLLTGDSSLHVDHLDFLARALHCCCGSGEWTRCVCFCFRRNLITLLGQKLGILSRSIKISNIVVGDLPAVGRNNYYVAVECKTDPEMVTSVAEMKLPKVVHFPEVLMVRLRRNLTEYRLRITVKKKNPVGHEEICEAHFTATSIMDFCDHDAGVMRFEMKALRGLETETPPWISLKFAYPVSRLENNIEEAPGDMFSTYFVPRASLVWNDEDELGAGMSISDFKDRYPLCDSEGYKAEGKEPSEGDVKLLYFCRAAFSIYVRVATLAGLWGLALFSLFRTYVRNCWKDYETYTMAFDGGQLWPNITWPLNPGTMEMISEECQAQAAYCKDNPDLVATTLQAMVCCPKLERVMAICAAPPWPGRERPYFLRRIVKEITSSDIGNAGFECRASSCDFAHEGWVKHDGAIFTFIIILMLSALCSRFFFDGTMRLCKKHCFKHTALHHTKYKQLRSERSAAGTSWFSGQSVAPPEPEPPQQNCIGCAVM